MEDVKNIVAKNITELRLLNNMTQLELAEKLNYSNKTISKWERAESTPDIYPCRNCNPLRRYTRLPC